MTRAAAHLWRLIQWACLAIAVTAASTSAAEPAETCLTPPYDDPDTPAHHTIADLVESLRSLQDFPSFADNLGTAGPTICLTQGLFGIKGYYAPTTRTIHLDAAMQPDLARAVLVHELRHFEQVDIGACPQPDLSMQQTARATFAMEADASALSFFVAWHLRAQGDPTMWDALAAWPHQHDIGEAYAAEMAESSDPVRAISSAFTQWYASDWRRQAYYEGACSAYLDGEDESHALPRYGALQPAFFDALCVLPDDVSYPCAEPQPWKP